MEQLWEAALSGGLVQVDSMALEDPGGSSRRVQGVVAALNELERFHSGEAALQTAHYLTLIRCVLVFPRETILNPMPRPSQRKTAFLGCVCRGPTHADLAWGLQAVNPSELQPGARNFVAEGM
jgi:hypothetical protein